MMIKKKVKTGLPFLWLSAVIFFIDLTTKYLVVRNFALYDSINIFPFFNLTYVRNYGAAFSFLADHSGWQKLFFIVLAFIVSCFLLYLLYKNNKDKCLQNASYALIIGGAFANAIDRAYNGFVIDFFDFYWKNWHYPVFNVADIGITIGAALLIFDSFKNKETKIKSDK